LPLTRREKEQAVETLRDRLERAEAVVVTDYRGLSVAQLSKLRRDLRARGAEFHVVKNSLTERALAEVGVSLPAELLTGPTGLAFLYEDLSAPTKALQDCAKETNILTIRGGLLSGKALDAKGINALADLPSREQLLAQLLGVIQGPQRQLVTVLNAPLRDLVSVLNAKVEADQAAA
jgi:large subunit ribosomal protein L10